MAKENVKRKPSRSHEGSHSDRIIIDEAHGLVFETEDELYAHFSSEIQHLEGEFFKRRKKSDIDLNSFSDYEELLSMVLEDPEEIWEDTRVLPGKTVYIYMGRYTIDQEDVYYAALTYVCEDTPSFVYLHFPSNDQELIEYYRQGHMIYDRSLKDVQKGALEGDALSEGDELAVGLYRSMLTVRSEKDIPEDQFQNFIELREDTIEEADEIWRSTDFKGNVLVSFIKEFHDIDDMDVSYIVVTIEDAASGSHALLFSFPTNDKSLVERYRHGENLQAEEVVQEASH